jgi:hypothetical protein
LDEFSSSAVNLEKALGRTYYEGCVCVTEMALRRIILLPMMPILMMADSVTENTQLKILILISVVSFVYVHHLNY